MDTVTVKAELTDTFGGEANYSWVRRVEFQVPERASDLSVIRKAKAMLGVSGMRHHKSGYGEGIELRWPSNCMVAFISFHY